MLQLFACFYTTLGESYPMKKLITKTLRKRPPWWLQKVQDLGSPILICFCPNLQTEQDSLWQN